MTDKSAKEILLEAFKEVKFASLSPEELKELEDLIDKKKAELKFVQRTKRKKI